MEPEIRESQLLVALHHFIMRRRERDNMRIEFGVIMKLFTKVLFLKKKLSKDLNK